MTNNIIDREAWYDRQADLPADKETQIKIAPKPAGELADGYSKIKTPELKESGHQQTKSERASVGGPWKR